MRKFFVPFFLILLPCVLSSCVSVSAIPHDPNKAEPVASAFARAAFIEKDYRKAYGLLWIGPASTMSYEDMVNTVKKMHPKGFPIKIAATDYEPMPGQRGMNIFLTGSNGGEKMYYRLAMAGDAKEGYKVSGFYRGNGPYPPSDLRSPLDK
jgi:hypothetical protein